MLRLGKRGGQVVVEMLLILPVFLTIVFTIMEMGHVAFQMILLNHATYEVARIGAMTLIRDNGRQRDCLTVVKPIMPRIIASAIATCGLEPTVYDDQAQQQNFDMLVTGRNPIKLIFPLSSILMSSKLLCPQGPGGGVCMISATVRMPVEQPLKY